MEQIYHLSRNFRKALEIVRKDQLYGRLRIFQNFPNGCCTYISDLLADYLYDNGITIKYVASGETNQEDYSHCWVVIEGDYIVDITADQFNGKAYFRDFCPIPKCHIVPNVHPLYTLFSCRINHPGTFGIESYCDGEIKRQLQTLYDVIMQLLKKEPGEL